MSVRTADALRDTLHPRTNDFGWRSDAKAVTIEKLVFIRAEFPEPGIRLSLQTDGVNRITAGA
jgi:hypothetical protein